MIITYAYIYIKAHGFESPWWLWYNIFYGILYRYSWLYPLLLTMSSTSCNPRSRTWFTRKSMIKFNYNFYRIDNSTCWVGWCLCYFLRAIIFKQWKRAMWTSCIWSRPFLAIGFLDISKCSSIVQWGWHTGSHGKVYNDSHHLIKQRLTTNSRRTNLTWD